MASYLAYRQELDEAWRRVMEGGHYILGREVAAFEREFSSYLEVSDAVGTANGTDSLQLALRALGIGAGDRVLTVSHTAVATIAAIELARAQPVFVDIDPATFTMDPNSLEDAIQRDRVRSKMYGPLKAVLVVHLYGQPADMPSILDIASRHGLFVVEDCAQCHGAALVGRKMGAWGDIAAFSFYPTKNLGTYGDGGAVVTRNQSLASRCRSLREYGWDDSRISQEAGVNSRLDELHAALLRVKLRHLERDNTDRRTLANVYDHHLAGAKVTTPIVRLGADHVYHQYVLRSVKRDLLRAELEREGIRTGVHYSPAAHQHPAFRNYYDHNSRTLLETERVAAEVISLPMYPQMMLTEAYQVAETVVRLTADFRSGFFR
jgi:dTDP-4-amino-4,6-dideoxygalactose transaminase